MESMIRVTAILCWPDHTWTEEEHKVPASLVLVDRYNRGPDDSGISDDWQKACQTYLAHRLFCLNSKARKVFVESYSL